MQLVKQAAVHVARMCWAGDLCLIFKVTDLTDHFPVPTSLHFMTVSEA